MKHCPGYLLVLILLGISACNLTPSTEPPPFAQVIVPKSTSQINVSIPSAAASPPAFISYQPTFEPAPCAFAIPSGYSPECGYLMVPENRARPDTRQISLHVAIFRNRSGMPNLDPVIKLAGGPGSSGLNTAGYILSKGMDAVLEQRDFIVFDQRGTGYSHPRLDCPERTSITSALLRGGVSAEASKGLIIDSFLRCRDRMLAEGIDLSAYNSAASAADINDLRSALGYDKLNLYAISYGTRLALTLMRDYPQAVRSAVLDSAYPLQVNLYTSLAPNADRAFNVFFDRCANDPGCSGSYPDLRAVFYSLVDELDARPIEVLLLVNGSQQSIQLDGDLLIDVLFVGLYNPAVTIRMPQMIYDIRRGEYTILRERLALYFESSTALGMQMAVQCSEEFPFNAPEEAFAAVEGIQPQIAAFYPVDVQPLFDVCKQWSSQSPDPRENLPVISDVPTLVLAGEGDPITPPDWGRIVAGDLPNSYLYEFPANGHWVTRSSTCAVEMALAFWEEPNVDPGFVC